MSHCLSFIFLVYKFHHSIVELGFHHQEIVLQGFFPLFSHLLYVVGRLMPPSNWGMSMPWVLEMEFVMLHGKRDFADIPKAVGF